MKIILNNTFFKFALGFAVILALSFAATFAIDRYAGKGEEVQITSAGAAVSE